MADVLPNSENIYIIPASNKHKPMQIITDDCEFNYNKETGMCTISKHISVDELIEILKENGYESIQLDQNQV